MKTNQSNKLTRSFCSGLKVRVLSLAFLLCLSGSAWAQPLGFNLADLFTLLKESLVMSEQQTPPSPNPPTPGATNNPRFEVAPPEPPLLTGSR